MLTLGSLGTLMLFYYCLLAEIETLSRPVQNSLLYPSWISHVFRHTVLVKVEPGCPFYTENKGAVN